MYQVATYILDDVPPSDMAMREVLGRRSRRAMYPGRTWYAAGGYTREHGGGITPQHHQREMEATTMPHVLCNDYYSQDRGKVQANLGPVYQRRGTLPHDYA